LRVITHHPSEAMMTAYAAGSLSEGIGLVVATHLSACPACRRLNQMLEAVGGVMLEDLPPAAMSPDGLALVLARGERPIVPPIAPRIEPGLPPPLNRCSFGPWWRVAPGIRWRPLRVRGSAWAGLLQVAPGRALPKHGHDGPELTCVLHGSFSDVTGRYLAGDVAEPELNDDHQPRVDGTETCLCVIASEGMRLRGLLGLAQRLLGR
jgi:putative transcriptional regulator